MDLNYYYPLELASYSKLYHDRKKDPYQVVVAEDRQSLIALAHLDSLQDLWIWKS